MYGYFSLESDERVLPSLHFETVAEAAGFLRNMPPLWQEITASGENEAAFLNPESGLVVVVREIDQP